MKRWPLYILLLTACGAPATPTLQASLAATAHVLTVTNGDHQAWTNVEVTVNRTFVCSTKTIAATKAVAIALISCTSSAGERFNPATMAPHTVFIRALLDQDGIEATTGFRLGR